RPDMAEGWAEPNQFRMFEVREALLKQGRHPEEAARVYERLIQMVDMYARQPNPNPYWVFVLGNWRFERGEFVAAEKALRYALELDPNEPSWRARRAECLGRLGLYSEAFQEAQTALRQNPSDPEANRVMEQLTHPPG